MTQLRHRHYVMGQRWKRHQPRVPTKVSYWLIGQRLAGILYKIIMVNHTSPTALQPAAGCGI